VNCCPECDAENGHEYTIEESTGMLPAHPLCRCTWLNGSKEMPEEYPTRDHLPSIMREKESVDQFMEDAELKGKIFTRGEATEIYDNVREFTSIDFYKEVRIYQTSGVEGLKIRNIEPWRIKRAQEIAQSLEEYSKYSMKYSRVNIYRGIDLTSKEVAAFKKGQIIDMMGTSSWSSDPLTAARFGNVQFVMKNKTGVSVKHISYTHGENEVIIAKGAKFKIIKITEGPKGIFDIYVEEVIAKVPKMPKVPIEIPERMLAIKPPTRGHLGIGLKEEQVKQIMITDAKAKGILLTEKEIDRTLRAISDWTGIGEHHYFRLYQMKGKQAVIDLVMKERNLSLYKAKKFADEVVESTKLIEKYLKFAPKYPEVEIYRGLKLTANEIKTFKAGQIFDMGGLSSFTSSIEKAKEYGDFIIRMKNVNGVSIHHLSSFTKEGEVLVSGKLKFKILEVNPYGMTIQQLGLPPTPKALFDFSVKTLPESKYTEIAAKSIKSLLKLEKVDLAGMQSFNANTLKEVLVQLNSKYKNNLSEIMLKNLPKKYAEVTYTAKGKLLLTLDKKTYKEMQFLVEKWLRDGQVTKFFAATTEANISASNFIHEFAHCIVDFNKLPANSPFRQEIIKIIAEYNKDLNLGKAGVFISKYAKEAEQVNEFIAEAFVNATASNSPSPYSKKVLALIDKYYGR